MKPPTRIRLRLLGRLAIAFADQPDPIRLSTRKSGALLAYLAMSPEQTARREELAALLWGGCSDQQARQSLRQALAMLRKELHWPQFLSADTDVVRLQPGQWSVDASDFEGLSKSSDPSDLDQAARLFGGEFLSGLNIDEEGFDEWVRGQRQRVQIAAARLCETLASRPDLVIDGQEAVAAAERLMSLDPMREDWQRLALTLYARYRGKNEALAQAEVFAAVLQRELGVAPEKETRTLVERIRAEEFGMIPGHAAPGPLPGATANERRSAPPTPGERPAPDRPSSPARQRWTLREHPSLGMAAAALIAVVALGGSFFGLRASHTSSDLPAGPKNVPAAKNLAAPASQPDPWQPPPSNSSAFAPKGIIPIAILPFTPLGEADASGQLIADMMTDDLTNLLSRIPSIRVISRQTMSRYRDQPIDVAAIGTELQVRYVLEGSTRTQDGVMRVNLQLLEPVTRLQVWSSRVEREGADRYAVRDEIVTRIARELQVNVMPIEGERRSSDPTADAADFLGWSAIFAGGSQISVDSYKKAESYFNQALARDPQRISALTGLAAFHGNMAGQRLDADTAYHIEKAREILGDVIRRDPDNATALFQLGVITQAGAAGPGTIEQSLSFFRRVVELNPSNPGGHAHIGHALARIGQPQQGIDYIHYAMRLSPRDPALSLWQEFLGNAQLELNQYAEAIESFRRSATLTPRYPRAWAGLAAAYALAGDAAGVKSSLDRLKAIAANAKSADAKSADPSPQILLERFGRRKDSQLHQGLALALAPADDPWQPPAPAGPAPEKAASTQPSGITAILVLPFTSVGEPGEQSALSADLITDDLTNALSRAAGFRVISRQTAMSYRGQQVDPAAVGIELGVHYVLEGTIETQGSGLSASVELIETKGRSRIWSGRYDRAGPDRLMILDDIARSVGRELQINVTHAEGTVRAQDPDVRALIYKGFSAIADAGRLGQPALEQSVKYFTQALAREPDNPRALTGLGMYHVQMAVNLYAPDPAPHLAKAEAILQQVIDRHPNAGGPYRLMGVLNIARGRPEIAAQWLQREIEINPSDAPSYAQLGRTMTMRGHPAEGIKFILYAMRLSPRDQAMAFWLGMAGMTELEQGNDQRAIAYLERQLALKPGHARALIVLAAIHALSGNPDATRARLDELRKALPHLSSEKLVERYFGESDGVQLRRLREGLRLAVSITRQSRGP